MVCGGKNRCAGGKIVISTRDRKTGRFFIPVSRCRGSNIAFYSEMSLKSRYGHVTLLFASWISQQFSVRRKKFLVFKIDNS
jgi:hypothetical protein